MARTLTYTHNRFDGGMTDDIRDVPTQSASLAQMALIKHCDIYRNRSVLYTMPGYVSRNSFAEAGNTNVKQYDIRAFNFNVSQDIYAVGTKSDGTGSKLLQYEESEQYWKVPEIGGAWAEEGTDNLATRPFLYYDNPQFYYPTVASGNTFVTEHGENATPHVDNDWATYYTFAQLTSQFKVKRGFDGVDYIAADGITGLKSISSGGLVGAKSTTMFVNDFETGNYQIGIVGFSTDPVRSQVLQWDSQSLLNDQNVQVGNGRARVVGYPNGIWTIVMDESMTSFTESDIEANGTPSMSVKALSGETAETIYRVFAPNNTNAVVETVVGGYRDAMAWYAKIPTEDGYNQGIWAFGRGELEGKAGVSILLDTESLGRVETCAWRGFDCWFAHNEDGSVSQLDDFTTGTYDVDATLETLVYGAKSPYLKGLKGLTINTSELTTQSVTVQYRLDRSTTWVDMGTSTKGQRHSFTKAQGGVVGRFQEIQFRIVLSGKMEVTGITIQIEETDDLPY